MENEGMIQPSRRVIGSGLSARQGTGSHGISVPPQAPGMGMRSKPPLLQEARTDSLCTVLQAASAAASASFQGLQAGWDSKGWISSDPKAPQCLTPRTT